MPREHRYFVYALTNRNNKVMYVGVTNDIERRLYEHKNKMVKGFTEKYNVNRLVYYEETSDILAAIAREKEIKKWRREKKDALVVAVNPEWKDLSEGWFEISPCGRDDTRGAVEIAGGGSFDRDDTSGTPSVEMTREGGHAR